MMYYLVKDPSGEIFLAQSLVGHDDCEVLEEGVTAPRVPHCRRVGGRWRIDKDASREQMIFSALSPMLARYIKSLEERISILEKASPSE